MNRDMWTIVILVASFLMLIGAGTIGACHETRKYKDPLTIDNVVFCLDQCGEGQLFNIYMDGRCVCLNGVTIVPPPPEAEK